jgi:hypothetical protein
MEILPLANTLRGFQHNNFGQLEILTDSNA